MIGEWFMGISRVYVFNNSRDFPIILTPVSGKSNILIDQIGNARIADFGLLTIISDPANPLGSASYTQGGTARWMSPELIDPRRFRFKNSCPTTSSDCYALGMVVYETISGHVPFHELADIAVFVNVLKGGRPPRENPFTDNLWKMLKRCWASHPKKRPSVEDVLQCLERAPNASDLRKRWRLSPFFPKFRPGWPSSFTTALTTPRGRSTPPGGGPIRNPNLRQLINPPLASPGSTWNQATGADKRNEPPPGLKNPQEVRHTVSGD